MANTRYTAIVNEIKADLRMSQGRTLDTTRLDSALTTAVNWFLSLHPSGWDFALVHVESAGANQSLSIQTDAGALGATFPVLPRLSGLWTVRTQVSATSGSWIPCKYLNWGDVVQRSSIYNRTATTTAAQKYWSLKIDGTVTATKRSVITLETFPYSYATNILYHQIDYRRASPTVASGANADDSFFWDVTAWDAIIKYFAEAMIASEFNDILPGMFDRAWGMARELAYRALVDVGVNERRVKFQWIGHRAQDEANL